MDRVAIVPWLRRQSQREQPHLVGLLSDPPDRTAALEAYAAALEEDDEDKRVQDRVKCEALRAILALPSARDDEHEAELRGTLRRALTDLPPEWLAVVLPTSVRNCGIPGPRAHPVIRFDYTCPRRWETLQPTDDPTVRRCDACARPVFRCDDLDTAEARARNGDCIAVDGSLAVQNNEPEQLVVGWAIPKTWGERLFGG